MVRKMKKAIYLLLAFVLLLALAGCGTTEAHRYGHAGIRNDYGRENVAPMPGSAGVDENNPDQLRDYLPGSDAEDSESMHDRSVARDSGAGKKAAPRNNGVRTRRIPTPYNAWVQKSARNDVAPGTISNTNPKYSAAGISA